ncbi:MAG: metabolite traffic protein EboE [Planctomycetes bacterium]|nr:metabolite traffic protein EboE [Planctomycetota bacterium]
MSDFRSAASGTRPLTYCTNVHAAANLDAFERVLREIVAPLLERRLGRNAPLLLGAWWPRDIVDELAVRSERREQHARVLDELGLIPASLNVFPAGRFHGPGVKESVYEPDWSTTERLEYTLRAAEVCAEFLTHARADRAVLSSVPLGFRGQMRERAPTVDHVHNVFRAALALDELHERTGVEVILALEPEPWCMLESIAEAIAWFDDVALPFAAGQGNEAAMRKHVGVCLDLCHAAVVGEDPIECLRRLARAGIRVGKVQLSSALVARGVRGHEALATQYRDPVYLHQTFEATGRVGPFVDLDAEVFGAASPVDTDVFLCHYHMPLHWRGDAMVETTQDMVIAFLQAIVAEPDLLDASVPLEVETYTNPKIEDELAFVVDTLQGAI